MTRNKCETVIEQKVFAKKPDLSKNKFVAKAMNPFLYIGYITAAN